MYVCGYQDHWQAYAYHYFHHRYFSCNYAGTNTAFLDVWFDDSFVGTLNPSDQKGCKPRPNAKSTLRVVPICSLGRLSDAPESCHYPCAPQIPTCLSYARCRLLSFIYHPSCSQSR